MGLFERRVQLICAHCGKEFSTPKSKAEKGAKYCSAECYEIARGTKILQRCPTCGEEFELRPSDLYGGRGKYCSRECGFEGRKRRVNCICEECGKEFQAWPSAIELGRGKYCSKACAARATGRHRQRDFDKYVCEQCGKAFEAKLTPAQLAEGDRRFCSQQCFARARLNRIEKSCEFCGKKIYPTPAALEKGQGRYCSKACADKARQKRIAFTCLVCGREFELEESRVANGRGRFCSKRCSLRYRGETSIEQLMREELERRNEPFDTQVEFNRYHVDFVLSHRMAVIECDGRYWHSKLDVFARDRRKDAYLENLGYRVFRFNDHEIRNSPADCVNQVLALASVVSTVE